MWIPIFNIVDMNSLNQDVTSESRIEKMKKFLSSPLTRKKPSGSQTKTFGTSLEILIQRTPSEAPVPYIVTRICQYIENTGLFHEGLFRISGNARLIERLKSCFDQSGDAPLETEGDVASAAALLKLFLRELPEPIIPLSMHQQFLNSVKDVSKVESIDQLMVLVEKLPFPNYSLLKYLSYFLMQVSQYEEQNRMSASSLGIVFGPNLFRVAEDFVGLKEQSLTNQIVTYFITDYYAIFHSEPEHVVKSNMLAASFDSSIKHISLDVNHSMVSSWPKLSSFPSSIMSSLSLRPLSVSIPTSEGYQISVNVETSSGDSEEHILMVDNSTIEDTAGCEQVSDQSEKDEFKGNGTHSAKRKRKERKLVQEDVLASYSALHDVANFIAIDDDEVFVDSKKVVHSFTVDSIAESDKHVDIQSNHGTPVQFDYCQTKPKKTESESCHDPLLDPQKSVKSRHVENNVTAHEVQRSFERTAPRLSPQRNRNSSKTLPSYTKPNGKVDDAAKFHTLSNLDQNVSIVKDALSAVTISDETSSGPTREQPNISQDSEASNTDKRFSHEHKRSRYSKGHRALYYKKQQQQLQEDARQDIATSADQETHVEKREMLLDGLKSSLDSDVEVSKPPSLTSEFEASAGTSASGSNGSNSDQRYSWPILKWLQDGDSTIASPANQFLKITSSTEAPLSPSAYRSYLSHRSPHLDPNLPPSPPVEQEDLATGVAGDANKANIKQLSKKIQCSKRKIKQFEENFEATHGYRPSYAEKSYYPEVKKVITELNEARLELKQLKEPVTFVDSATPQNWSPSDDSSSNHTEKTSKSTNTCRFGSCIGPVLSDGTTITIEESLNEALDYLIEKRKAMSRPEVLEEMSRDQLVEEKFTIQKLLLQFESIHGRPSSKSHRDLMRPLYDRYRNAKRILARSASFGSLAKGKDSVELQPILEHETMDFKSVEATDAAQTEPQSTNNGDIAAKNENSTVREVNEDPGCSDAKPSNVNSVKLLQDVDILKTHTNLHELSLPELFEQQQQARSEKRRLRGILREFETRFLKDKGRKIQREDKGEMETVYNAYKNVRAKTRLLEALVTKHEHKK